MLKNKYEPRSGSRALGALMKVFKFNFRSEEFFIEDVQEWTSVVESYEKSNKEVLSDSIKCAALSMQAPAAVRNYIHVHMPDLNDFDTMLRNITNWLLAQKSWSNFTPNVYPDSGGAGHGRGKQQQQQAYDPMDVGGVLPGGKGKGDKGKGGKGKREPVPLAERECYNCGKKGHMAKDCRSQAKPKGKGKGKSKSKIGAVDLEGEEWIEQPPQQATQYAQQPAASSWQQQPQQQPVQQRAPQTQQQQQPPRQQLQQQQQQYHGAVMHGESDDEGQPWVFSVCAEVDERLVGGYDDGEFVDVMIDSGAVVSVVPKDFAPQVPLDTRDTRPYYSVQGLPIEHFGSRNVPIELETGDGGMWKVEATNSKKFIMSVAKSVENGASVTFTRDGGFLQKPGKAPVKLHRHGDLYYMRVKLKRSVVHAVQLNQRFIAPIAP